MPRINPNNRDFISLLSDFLQFYNTNLLQEDASNNDLMKELQHQNKDYLENILTKLDKILEKCDELSNENSLLKKQLSLALGGLQEYAKKENWYSIYDTESFNQEPLWRDMKWKEEFGYKYAQDILLKIKDVKK